jgi:hypothetical protein
VHFVGLFIRCKHPTNDSIGGLKDTSSPDEIYRQTTRDADFPKLLKVAKMCHKYTLPTFETWALDMILIQCESLEGPSHLSVCAEDLLLELMTLALLSDHSRLLDLVETTWLSRLCAGELPCKSALVAGERHGRTRFLANVYYHLYKELCTSTLEPSTSPFSHLDLADEQLFRLLSGYTLLSNFWNHLRGDPLPRKISCSNHNGNCMVIWGRIPWVSFSSPDVLKSLHSAQNYIATNNAYYQDQCPGRHLKQIIMEFRIVDYFFGPQDS